MDVLSSDEGVEFFQEIKEGTVFERLKGWTFYRAIRGRCFIERLGVDVSSSD